jgi:hypothetical protein
VLDALRAKEIQRRRDYFDELVLLAEVEARGVATRLGCHVGHVGTVALLPANAE